MTALHDIKQELWGIAKAYPTLTGLLQREVGKSSLGEHWATMLKEFDFDDVADICDQYAQCRRQLPKPSDGLIFELVEYCRDARYERMRKLEQYEKVHRPCKMPWRDDNNRTRWCHAVKFLMAAPVSEEDLDAIVEWSRGGDVPDCMNSEEKTAVA